MWCFFEWGKLCGLCASPSVGGRFSVNPPCCFRTTWLEVWRSSKAFDVNLQFFGSSVSSRVSEASDPLVSSLSHRPVCFHVLLQGTLTPCLLFFLSRQKCHLGTTEAVGGRDDTLIRTLLFLFIWEFFWCSDMFSLSQTYSLISGLRNIQDF